MTSEHEAEGEIARRGASLQGVVDFQELGVAIALIAGRKCGQFDCNPAAARHPLKAGSCGEAQRAGRIARDRDCRNVEKRRMAHAQAQPRGAVSDDEMALGLRCGFHQWLSAGQQRYRAARIGRFDDHDIRRGVR